MSKLTGAVHLEITLPFMFIIITLKIKNQDKVIIIFLKLNIASLLIYSFFSLPPKIRLQGNQQNLSHQGRVLAWHFLWR